MSDRAIGSYFALLGLLNNQMNCLSVESGDRLALTLTKLKIPQLNSALQNSTLLGLCEILKRGVWRAQPDRNLGQGFRFVERATWRSSTSKEASRTPSATTLPCPSNLAVSGSVGRRLRIVVWSHRSISGCRDIFILASVTEERI